MRGRPEYRFGPRGLPVAIAGFETEPSTDAPEAIARGFLDAHADLLLGGETTAHLATERVLAGPLATSVRFVQHHEGVPVFGSSLVVQLDREGRVRGVNGEYYPWVRLPSFFAMRAEDAVRAARRAVPGFEDGLAAKAVVLPGDATKAPELAWDVSGGYLQGEHLLLGDADGLVRTRYGTVCAETAYVYPQDPIATPLLPVILPETTERRFLADPHVSIKLQGTDRVDWSAIESADSTSLGQPEVGNVYGEFLFEDEKDPRLAEVEAYYEVNAAHDFFRNRFGLQALDFPLTVVVNIPNDASGQPFFNAFFAREGTGGAGALVFGAPQRDLNFALDATVICHEYTHAVVSYTCNLTYEGESAALNECFADYFSSVQCRTTRVGAYVDARSTLGPIVNRDMASPEEQALHYPEALTGECHDDSRLFAATLYRVTQDLGQNVAPGVVYTALTALSSNATFADAALAVVNATQLAAPGKGGVVRQRFVERGILDAPNAPTPGATPDAAPFAATHGHRVVSMKAGI